MLKFFCTIGLIVLFALPGQAQLDGYKYIVVPKKFDGFKNENQFRTSTQIKHLFTQNGFTAIYDDQITPDLAEDPCKGLRVLLLDNSSLLATKVTLGLRDCNGVTVYESAEGRSKSKEYETAFRQAINEAFFSFTELGYAYKLSEAAEAKATESQEATPEPAEETVVTAVAAVPAVKETVQEPAQDGNAAGITTGAVAATGIAVGVQGEAGEEIWYAQPTENGYQLVDSTPRVRMKLLKTAQEDTFIATIDDAPMGMVYKKDGQWWHEFFKDGKTEVQPLKLKF